MIVKKLAAYYLKFWSERSNGNWVLADNAPTELQQFVWPKVGIQNLVREAFGVIATGVISEIPSTTALLGQAVISPSLVLQCDMALASRQPPKTMSTLLRQAYLNEVGAVAAQVKEFLQTEINKF